MASIGADLSRNSKFWKVFLIVGKDVNEFGGTEVLTKTAMGRGS